MANKSSNKGNKKPSKARSTKKGTRTPKARKINPEVSRRKQVIGLRKWNRAVKYLIKDYKRRGISYDYADVRKEASAIYPALKEIPYSRITQRSVITAPRIIRRPPPPKKTTFTIQSTEVPKKWFETEMNFWDLATEIEDFSQAYPEIPIVIKSPENEYASKGAIDDYSGSELQNFVEELRSEIGDDYEDYTFTGTSAWQSSPNKQFAFWGAGKVAFPKSLSQVDVIEPERQKEIEVREEKIIEEKKPPLPKKKKIVAEIKKVKKEKKEVGKKPSEFEKEAQLIRRREGIMKAVEMGIMSKEDAKKEFKKLGD